MRKNKFIQRKQEAIKNTILLLILILGLGYALLQQNLTITGTSHVNNPTWDIHWNNVQVQDGSVTGSNVVTPPTINNAKTTVTYSIILSKPGDYYEFTVDAVNAGTIDGMIESITSKLNGTPITTLPAYLEYTVTYEDDDPLAANQLLAAGTTETYKVKIKYRDDIELDQIPATNQTLSLQFTVKYKQAGENAVPPHQYLYNVLKKATEEEIAIEYTGEHHDSFTEEPTKKIYIWSFDWQGNNKDEILNKMNVIFGGFCWQMIRTTDTGGIKMMYNGIPNSGKCTSNGTIGSTKINTIGNGSFAYVGYMYNPNYAYQIVRIRSSAYYEDVVYNNGEYTVTGTTTTTPNATHHYVCQNGQTSCSTVRYVFSMYRINNNPEIYGIELNNGKKIEDAVEDMLWADDVNQQDSTLKTFIETWYENNLLQYGDYLEDTIFCNGRSILPSFNPYGGTMSDTSYIRFSRTDDSTLLSCVKETDKFCVSNNKAKLKYPIGLFTYAEMNILRPNFMFSSIYDYTVLMTPYAFNTNYNYDPFIEYYRATRDGLAGMGIVGSGNHGLIDNYYVKPAISLAPNIGYISGDGSKNNPYIVQ